MVKVQERYGATRGGARAAQDSQTGHLRRRSGWVPAMPRAAGSQGEAPTMPGGLSAAGRPREWPQRLPEEQLGQGHEMLTRQAPPWAETLHSSNRGMRGTPGQVGHGLERDGTEVRR